MDITIRRPLAEEAALLPAIETSAGELFRQIPDLAWIADDSVMSAEAHLAHIAHGTEWIAESAGRPVAFLAGERISRATAEIQRAAEVEDGLLHEPESAFHIRELAVHAGWQGRGIGRRLVNEAVSYARECGMEVVTLTTFEDVPWNAPWYSRQGFELLDASSLSTRLAMLLRDERERGLPRRCAMRMNLSPPSSTQGRR